MPVYSIASDCRLTGVVSSNNNFITALVMNSLGLLSGAIKVPEENYHRQDFSADCPSPVTACLHGAPNLMGLGEHPKQIHLLS
ncbi:hypothetical protein BaRGS_00010366 [Batillaria attramentaria]|uniref:Uncharacterized protein n=1 Tax=Batillaria attramentaria TaxID=370345 RepID=A0ABD0LGF5_9CAEN